LAIGGKFNECAIQHAETTPSANLHNACVIVCQFNTEIMNRFWNQLLFLDFSLIFMKIYKLKITLLTYNN